MITFYLDIDEVSWSNNEYDLDNNDPLVKVDHYEYEMITNKISDYIDQVLLCEHMIESENLLITITGDECIDQEFMIYKQCIATDRSTNLFVEFIIARKDRIVTEFKQYLNQLILKGYDINFSEKLGNIVNRKWTISYDYKLKPYKMFEEE